MDPIHELNQIKYTYRPGSERSEHGPYPRIESNEIY
jgi:hypothetical protein